MNLRDKNIFITGANRGIGRAMALEAARHKMKVHPVIRSIDESLEVELKKAGAQDVRTWQLDLSESQNIERFFERFQSSGEQCDLLFNNAGQLTGGLLEEQDPASIYKMLQVNLTGLIHLTQLMLPHLLERPEAKIINNASVSGYMSFPCASTYAASKAGVIAFTQSLSAELMGTTVSTLTLVTPGVKTRMFDDISELYSGHLDLKFLSSIPAEKWARKVFKAIKKDESFCLPSGNSYWGVQMARYFPGLFKKTIRSYFSRNSQ